MSVGTMSVAIGVATVARLWLISCLFVDNALSQLTSTGQTVTVGKIPYYVPAKPVTTVALWGYHGTQSCGELQPVTVLGSSENIQTTVDGFAKADDVWNYGFARSKYTSAVSVIRLTLQFSLDIQWGSFQSGDVMFIGCKLNILL